MRWCSAGAGTPPAVLGSLHVDCRTVTPRPHGPAAARQQVIEAAKRAGATRIFAVDINPGAAR